MIEKEGFRIAGILFFLGFGYFTQNYIYSTLTIIVTLLFSLLMAIISKRSSYLIVMENPVRNMQAKISLVYAIVICLNISLLIHLRNEYMKTFFKTDRMLCELLIFENIMLVIRFFTNYVKYTLSLWCLYSNKDFRIKFPWYSLVKNICLIIGFIVLFK